MIDISIIVPIYNASKYLEKCLDSLIKQTKRELEFILVNDGSIDDSEDVIKRYTDKRIRYFKNKNQGIGKTRNFGIDKSRGKYIMFLDSDDYLSLDACEKLYQKAVRDDLDVVVCNFYEVRENRIEENEIPCFINTSLKEKKDLLLDINLAPWNKLYSSSLIKENKIRFIEDLKYEDAPFVIESLDKARKIGHIEQCLNYYVIHKSSETTIRDERVFDIIKIVDIIRNYFYGNKEIKDIVDTLTISILANYNIQQRYQKDALVRDKFINASFAYLKENIPNYRKNSYFKKRNVLKSLIEKNKLFTKIYCKIYGGLKK